jgi:hypothetical protein
MGALLPPFPFPSSSEVYRMYLHSIHLGLVVASRHEPLRLPITHHCLKNTANITCTWGGVENHLLIYNLCTEDVLILSTSLVR